MDFQKQIKTFSDFMHKSQQEKYRKDTIDFFISIISKSYEKSSAYTNLIIVAGYVLFFTFWGNVKDNLDLFWSGISASLVILSVLFFVIWEIYVMIASSLNLRKMHNVLKVPPEKFPEQIQIFTKETERHQARFGSLWVLQLILTIVPGFAGVLILLVLFVRYIWQ